MFSSVNTRKATNKLLDLLDAGVIDPLSLAKECMAYMSEADVADMAATVGYLDFEDFEE